jgi:hypothetical protein
VSTLAVGGHWQRRRIGWKGRIRPAKGPAALSGSRDPSGFGRVIELVPAWTWSSAYCRPRPAVNVPMVRTSVYRSGGTAPPLASQYGPHPVSMTGQLGLVTTGASYRV